MLQCAPNLLMMNLIKWVLKVATPKFQLLRITETIKRNFLLLQVKILSVYRQRMRWARVKLSVSIQCSLNSQLQVVWCATRLWLNKKSDSCRKSRKDKSANSQWYLIKKSQCKRSMRRIERTISIVFLLETLTLHLNEKFLSTKTPWDFDANLEISDSNWSISDPKFFYQFTDLAVNPG